jgi:AcrR family transcriptional regulator
LEAARKAFRNSGVMASLDDIAKQAGVGAGTLYRHFPSRNDLLEAVYDDEIFKLAEAGRKFARDLQPIEALRAWMLLFIECIAAEKIIAPALNSSIGVASAACAETTRLVAVEIEALVARAVQSGEIRSDLDPMDLLRALVGVANVAASPNWEQSAKRLVDILILGSKVEISRSR